MEKGLILEKTFVPTSENSAKNVGSGCLDVLSTPSVLASMENVAMSCVVPHLAEGETTVGTLANFQHVKASKIGDAYKVKAELTEVDRRRLVFSVQATNENGEILATGIHERFIVNAEKFMSKLG